MTSKELREVFIHELPVRYQGSVYKKVSRISFLKDKEGSIVESATLIDICGRSEVTVPGKDVMPCE